MFDKDNNYSREALVVQHFGHLCNYEQTSHIVRSDFIPGWIKFGYEFCLAYADHEYSLQSPKVWARDRADDSSEQPLFGWLSQSRIKRNPYHDHHDLLTSGIVRPAYALR